MDLGSVRVMESESNMHCNLHPLVIINASEHWTREKAQNLERREHKVCGALLGIRAGRNAELRNSFELPLKSSANEQKLLPCDVFDVEHFFCRQKQYKEMFDELEVIGYYYCTGDDEHFDQDEVELYRQFGRLIELPIVLKLNPYKQSGSSSKLPIVMYESVQSDTVAGLNELYKLDYAVISEESERVGVDHIVRYSTNSSSGSESVPAKSLKSHVSAVEMLLGRVTVMSNYLRQVIEGKLPLNEDILREVKKASDTLKLVEMKCSKTKDIAHVDITLSTLLSGLTEMGAEFSQLLHRVNQIASERAMSLMSSRSDRDSPLGSGSRKTRMMLGMPFDEYMASQSQPFDA